jgi:hypothetical protein
MATLFIVVRTASLDDRKTRCGETHNFHGSGYVVIVRHGSTAAYKEGALLAVPLRDL